MKPYIVIILTVVSTVTTVSCFHVERWPDGSAIDKWFTQIPKHKEKKIFNILDYGASSDSTVLQTSSIQAAIDAAAVKGGCVLIPKGVYLSSSLFFKKGTSLYLEEGAVLKGSDNISDYPTAKVHIEGVKQDYIAALVNAYCVDGFEITGNGTIDGNGLNYWTAFWDRRKENPDCTNLEVKRPRLIYIAESSDVTIEGVSLKNPGFWTTHLYKCQKVAIRNVRITAPTTAIKAPSSDAIDIDGCSKVHIDRCDISVNDDFIALKGGKGPWADKDPDNCPDNEILIENCVFRDGPHVLTFGSECFDAQNVIMRDCKVRGTRVLLRMKIRPDTPQKYRHIRLERITGRTGTLVHIRPWTQFYDLKDRSDNPMSYVSDVTVRDCNLKCWHVKNIDVAPELAEIDSIKMERDSLYAVNYDSKEIRNYQLEDPLTFANGCQLTDAKQWPERRKEILDIFQREMYGRLPEAIKIYCDTLEQGTSIAGFGIRTQIKMYFREDRTGPCINWLVVRPAHSRGPVPVVLALNYYGNHTLLEDTQIVETDPPMDDEPMPRGYFLSSDNRYAYPIGMIVARGWAFVTAGYADISPDPHEPEGQQKYAYTKVFGLWGERNPECDDNTTALMAWAWALSRGMDYIESTAAFDSRRVLLTGCSRLGKAALLAGAYDERFPVVVPVQTGAGGVPLAKRNYGESIDSEVRMFTHWFCKKYSTYANNEQNMPFDQHLLLAAVAPRALLVEGFDDPWFDTEGEFLAVKAASKVWPFLGRQGLPDVGWPDDYDTSAIGRDLGYVHRNLQHGISYIDWIWMLDFAENQFQMSDSSNQRISASSSSSLSD